AASRNSFSASSKLSRTVSMNFSSAVAAFLLVTITTPVSRIDDTHTTAYCTFYRTIGIRKCERMSAKLNEKTLDMTRLKVLSTFLVRTKDTVSRITEPRHNVGIFIKMAIDGGCVNMH